MKILRRGLVAMALLGLGACSKPEPINQTHTGRIDATDSVLSTDNSNYDAYEFEAAEGMIITITATSTELDPYVHLMDKNGNQLAHDDDGGGGTTARVTYTAPYSGSYEAYANTARPGETGSYTLTIHTGSLASQVIPTAAGAPAGPTTPTPK